MPNHVRLGRMKNHARKTQTMQLLQFIAGWLFPGAVCAADAKVARSKATISEPSSEHDNASSSPAFSVEAADSGSSMSSSPSSSSSSDDHPRFFTPGQQSPPASPLCFGAGGRLLLRGARARSPTKQQEAASVAVAPAKADVVGRYLGKISRRLRKSRTTIHEAPPSPGRAVDDTAREMAESVARAISYCKDTLRRGEAPPAPRPAPSPSFDDWLHGRQEEIISSAAAAYCDGESTDSRSEIPPPRPRPDGSSLAAHRGIIKCRVSQPPPHRGGGLAVVMQAVAKQRKEPACPPSPSRDASITATSDVAYGEEPPHHGLDAIEKHRGESVTAAETAMSSSPSELQMGSSFDEMQFLKIFHGDEEMIGHHFITLKI